MARTSSNCQGRGKGVSGGFTLIELLVVISIISLLIALLLPALSSAKAAAQSALALSNHHQIGVATASFVAEHSDQYPHPYMGYPGHFVTSQSATLAAPHPASNDCALYADELWDGEYVNSPKVFSDPGMPEYFPDAVTLVPESIAPGVSYLANGFIGGSSMRSTVNPTSYRWQRPDVVGGGKRFKNSDLVRPSDGMWIADANISNHEPLRSCATTFGTKGTRPGLALSCSMFDGYAEMVNRTLMFSFYTTGTALIWPTQAQVPGFRASLWDLIHHNPPGRITPSNPADYYDDAGPNDP